MTDNNAQERIESRGATVEEAVSEALLMLGARRDEVEIEVLDEGKAGVFGLFGKRAARVAVTRRRKRSRGRRGGRRRRRSPEGKPQEARSESRQDSGSDKRDDAREGSRGGRRGGRRDDTGRRGDPERRGRTERQGDDGDPRRRRQRPERQRQEPAREERAAAESKDMPAGGDADPSRPRSRRPRRRPSRRRPGSEAAPVPEAGAVNEVAPVEETPRPVDETPRPVEEAPAPVETAPAPEPRTETPPAAAGETIVAAELVPPTRGRSVDETAEVQRGLAEELMRRSGFAARVTVTEDDYNQVKVVADADSAAVLIGRRGSTIDAVEHLVDRMAIQAVGERVHMNLDINNYRQRRQGVLEDSAQSAVRQLKDTGKDVHLPPQVARERRIVHLAIEPIEGVTTFTAGAGPDRHVVVTFEKDETEDAPVETPVNEVETPPTPEPEALEEEKPDTDEAP